MCRENGLGNFGAASSRGQKAGGVSLAKLLMLNPPAAMGREAWSMQGHRAERCRWTPVIAFEGGPSQTGWQTESTVQYEEHKALSVG